MKLSIVSMMALLAIAPMARAQDLQTTFQSLQDAEAKGDAASVKKLAGETSALARKAAAEPAPQDAADKEAWTSRITYAKDVDVQSEYALYSVALKSPPATMVDLLGALEQQNPQCKYLDQAYASYLYALSQTGESAKIPEIAEKALVNFPENTDLLLVMVNSTFAAKQSDKAQSYATRLIAAWDKKAKPEGISDADWSKQKESAVGKGYFVDGMVSADKGQYLAADKSLRAALPYLKGNNTMLAPALFYLGTANYNLGKSAASKAKILEGAKFSEQCASIPGSMAAQAGKNATVMKAEAARMR